MHVEWYGQSAFRLKAGDVTVAIDPFGAVSALAGRGLRFDYPPITGLEADLLLVTHEHLDHNAVEAVGGDPVVLRSTAGRLDSPIGDDVRAGARWVVPMHYRTARTSFLEPADAFLDRFTRVARLDAPEFSLEALGNGDGPLAVVPTAP